MVFLNHLNHFLEGTSLLPSAFDLEQNALCTRSLQRHVSCHFHRVHTEWPKHLGKLCFQLCSQNMNIEFVCSSKNYNNLSIKKWMQGKMWTKQDRGFSEKRVKLWRFGSSALTCSQSRKVVYLNLTKKYTKALDLEKRVRNTAALIQDISSYTEAGNRNREKRAR